MLDSSLCLRSACQWQECQHVMRGTHSLGGLKKVHCLAECVCCSVLPTYQAIGCLGTQVLEHLIEVRVGSRVVFVLSM
jgi:hypothetical protein